MHDPLISVIPAQPGYSVSTRRSAIFNDSAGAWSALETVIAWGFSKHDSRPLPLSLVGAPSDDEEWRIKTPEGRVITV